MIIKKISFNSENSFVTSANQMFIGQFLSPKANRLKIELIEILNVQTPSVLTFTIKISDKTLVVPLYRHRTKFIFQNNIFALDTSSLAELDIDISKHDFSIEVSSEAGETEDFNLTMYCSTDQKQFQEDLLIL